ncbi:MAG: hypothetical protein KDI55_02480 [Anaerolineae bacterium]|nr:hypothetical protein [Anaerolineae bacterium]MCP5428545.1 hypothetical protein [Chromatiaceae bacterium]
MANDYSLKISIITAYEQTKKALKDLKNWVTGAGDAVRKMGDQGNYGAGRFERAMDRVKGSTNSATTSLKNAASAARNFWGTVAGVVTGTIIGGIVRINASFQKLHASLVTVTGSAGNADKAFADIKQFAKETPFQVEEITQAFIKLKALGLEPSMVALRSYGNTAAAMGKTLDQFVEAIADAAVGEFERLKEFGIKAASEGENVRFTFQGVTTTVKKNAKEIEQYLRGLGDVQFAGAMQRQMETIGGAFSNLKDTIAEIASAIGEAGLNKVLVEGLKAASAGLAEYKDNIAGIAGAIVNTITVAGSAIRAVFNTITAAAGSVATAISFLAEQILRAFSAITFGDLSRQYAQMADNIALFTKALKKGVLTDLDDIKNAVGDISDSLDSDLAEKNRKAAEAEAKDAERQAQAKRKANLERAALDAIRKKDAAEAAAAVQKIVEQETKAISAELKKREAEYKRHLAELTKIKEQQKTVQEEFAKAVADMFSSAKPEEPGGDAAPTARDAQNLTNRAGYELQHGDPNKAIESARAAIEALRQIKAAGTESDFTLQQMARTLESIAKTAAEKIGDVKVIDTDKAEGDIEQLKAKLAELEAAGKNTKIEVAAKVDAAALVAEVQRAVAQAQAAAPPIVIRTVTRGGQTTFSDGTELPPSTEDIVSRELLARGSR